jgi:tetratricopeptide (TPR) repeat protein
LSYGHTIYIAEMTYSFMGAICVRSMEPDVVVAAKAAAVDQPVADIQTLQNFIPLNKARLAYQAGNYQESIAETQTAISLKADPATDYWDIGISYGRLGQWDQAIANLQSTLAIDKNFGDAETALKWAKDGLKTAKKGKLPKEPSPKWN